MERRKIELTDWRPLERVVGERYLPDFMYMGKNQLGERSLLLYKHIFTRRYLILDDSGGAYRVQGSEYVAINLTEALVHAFGTVDVPRIADQFRAAVDVVELSRIYKYAGQVRLYFVILDPDIALWLLASVCASGSVAQLNEWAERGQVLILNQPHLIPGLSSTSVEVLRTEEVYFVKPALNEILSGVRRNANGVLILRVLNASLPAFLKPGIEAVFISEDKDFDKAIRSLQLEVPILVDSKPMSGFSESTLERLTLEYLKETKTDIVMLGSHVLCRMSRPSNLKSGQAAEL